MNNSIEIKIDILIDNIYYIEEETKLLIEYDYPDDRELYICDREGLDNWSFEIQKEVGKIMEEFKGKEDQMPARLELLERRLEDLRFVFKYL